MSDRQYTVPGIPFGRAAAYDTRAVFGQVMGLVAVTLGFCAGGAYIGRNLRSGTGIVFFILAIVCLFGLNFAARRSERLAVTLLFAFGLLMGLALGPGLAQYARTEPQVVWQAAGCTGLFVGALGSLGYAIRRDLSYLYRFLFFALLGLIVAGLVLTLAHVSRANRLYSIAGLAIFGGYTVVDFNRLKRAGTQEIVPLAAGIFLDILNVFLFFLSLLGNRD